MKKYATVILSLLFFSPLVAEAKRGSYTYTSSYSHGSDAQKSNKDKDKEKSTKESWTTVSNIFVDGSGRVFWIKADNSKKK